MVLGRVYAFLRRTSDPHVVLGLIILSLRLGPPDKPLHGED